MKKFLSVLAFAFVLVLTMPTVYLANTDEGNWIDYAATSFSAGKGSESNPYQIDTPEELALLAKVMNDQNSAYLGKYYVLCADIDLSGHNWTPIGAIKNNYDTYWGFEGHFDGREYCISNMKIDDDGEKYQLGLFGWNLGTICNVHLKDAEIAFESVREGWQAENGMGTSLEIGGIVGHAGEGSLVKNCTVENILIDVKSTMSLACGGLAGGVNYGTIEKSEVTGAIQATSGRAVWAGGFVGHIGNAVVIQKCGFKGSIESENDGNLEFENSLQDGMHYLHYVGGFTGSLGRANKDIYVEDCYAIADVKATAENSVPEAAGFSGALGIVYGDVSFRNLYCQSNVSIETGDEKYQIEDFVRGERGFRQSDADSYTCENCVAINQDDISVYSSKLNDEVNIKVYDRNGTDLNSLLKKIGFSEQVWAFSEGSLPTLRYKMNGLLKSEDGKWLYYKEGIVDTTYTALAKNDYGWWYVKNGKLDTTYTGMAKNDYGWWYVKNGKLDTTYTGMAKNDYGWWYMKNGKLDTQYTGMAKNDYGWWYMKKGKLDTSYTGMAKNDYGWWYMKKGKLDTSYTGMAKNEYGWWYMKKGKLDTSYTGIASNEYGQWYMKKGKLDTSYTGTYSSGGKTYTIEKGKVTSVK